MRVMATDLNRWRIAANASPAPIAAKTWFRSRVLRCGLMAFSERPCQVGFLHNSRHGYHSLVFRTGPRSEPSVAPIFVWRRDLLKQQPRAPSIRCSIVTVMSAKNLYEFPRADHAQSTLI